MAHLERQIGIFVLRALYSVTVSRREPAVRSTDRQTVTLDELQVAQALAEEVSREMGHLGARVAALEEGKTDEGKELGLTFAHHWRFSCSIQGHDR